MPSMGLHAKKDGRSKTVQKVDATQAVLPDQQAVSTSKTGGTIAITVHAKPNAKESGVVAISDTAVDVQIAAPAKDGEANAELIRFMAATLGLKKSQFTLDKGTKTREKTLLLDADCGLTVNDVVARLKSESGK